jgi:hypothetical protein
MDGASREPDVVPELSGWDDEVDKAIGFDNAVRHIPHRLLADRPVGDDCAISEERQYRKCVPRTIRKPRPFTDLGPIPGLQCRKWVSHDYKVPVSGEHDAMLIRQPAKRLSNIFELKPARRGNSGGCDHFGSLDEHLVDRCPDCAIRCIHGSDYTSWTHA